MINLTTLYRRMTISYIANVKFSYSTVSGNTRSMFQKVRTHEREEKSVLQELRSKFSGTDFEIHRMSWL